MIFQNWQSSPRTVAVIVFFIILLPMILYLINQVRRPTKWIGRLFAKLMNVSHTGLTDWGLKHIKVEDDFVILDVGCGGGRTVHKLSGMAMKGSVFGVDHATGSVAASCGTNAQLIRQGRVEIKHGSVSALPYSEDKFDLVMAVETHFYWPNLAKDMQEIQRVLKPGGALVIITESYNNGLNDWWQGPVMKLLRSTKLEIREHQELFLAAGYGDIQVFEERSKGWLCVIGKKEQSRSVLKQ